MSDATQGRQTNSTTEIADLASAVISMQSKLEELTLYYRKLTHLMIVIMLISAATLCTLIAGSH